MCQNLYIVNNYSDLLIVTWQYILWCHINCLTIIIIVNGSDNVLSYTLCRQTDGLICYFCAGVSRTTKCQILTTVLRMLTSCWHRMWRSCLTVLLNSTQTSARLLSHYLASFHSSLRCIAVVVSAYRYIAITSLPIIPFFCRISRSILNRFQPNLQTQ